MFMKDLCLGCFKNLSTDSRFKIYEYVKNNKTACVTDITKFTNLKQPTVSYHLKEMENSGLLNRQIEGKKVYVSINKNCPFDGSKCIVH